MSKKAIALLELTVGSIQIDTSEYKSISYYWTKTPIFNTFPVIDVGTGIGNTITEKTIYLLNKYYSEGFRIFLGFNRSTILAACVSWFQEHPDTVGISMTSTANSLQIPKNIYRLSPNDETGLQAINNYLENAISSGGKIYYVYSQGELAAEDTLIYLNTVYGADNIESFGVLPNSSNLTFSNLNTFFAGADSDSVVVTNIFVGNQRENYIALFNPSELNLPFNQYDISASTLPDINASTTTLKNKYICLLVKSVTTSSLWNDGLKYLGNSFLAQSLNALYLITTLVNNVSIQNIYSYNGVLQFNENNDIKYYNYGFFKYTNEGIYFSDTIFSQDPIYGSVYFNIVT